MQARRTLCAAALVAAIAAIPALAACSDDGGTAAATAPATATAPTTPATADQPSPAAGIMLADSGASVAEILAAPASEDLVVVRAHVIVAADGTARLCDALRESLPPQCGGASMALENLPQGFLTGLSEAQGVHWTEQPAQLVGRVRGDVFVNDPEALVAS